MNPNSDESLEAMLRTLTPQPHPMNSLDAVYACGFAAGQQSLPQRATAPMLGTTWSLRDCIRIAATVTAILGTGLSGYWMGRAGQGRERDRVAAVTDVISQVPTAPAITPAEESNQHADTRQGFSVHNNPNEHLATIPLHHEWWNALVNYWLLDDSVSSTQSPNQTSRKAILQSGPLKRESVFFVSSRDIENFVYSKPPTRDSTNTSNHAVPSLPDLSDHDRELNSSSHWTPFLYRRNTIRWDEEIQ